MSQMGSLLIVDDESDLRDAIAIDLSRKGYKIFEAGNGLEAIQVLQANDVELVISDVRMPVKDGVELLKWVQARNIERPAIVLMSGFSDFTVEEAFHCGASGFFNKPFSRKGMLEEIQRHLLAVRGHRFETKPDSSFIKGKTFEITENPSDSSKISLGRSGFFAPQIFEHKIGEFFPFILGSWSGIAVTRWIRGSQVGGSPAGSGFEFIYFENDCRNAAREVLTSLKTTSSIPLA